MQDYQTPLAPPGQPPPGIKTYPSAVARAKAANAEFIAVADKYGMTPDGKVARYFAGLTAIEAGQNDAAESALKQVAGSWNANIAALAKLSLAQLYRQTKPRLPGHRDLHPAHRQAHQHRSRRARADQLAELYEAEGNPRQGERDLRPAEGQGCQGTAGQLAAQKLNPAPAGPAGLQAQ